ncbi:hypothetical protein Dimus_026677 [Dionaea muscipula]
MHLREAFTQMEKVLMAKSDNQERVDEPSTLVGDEVMIDAGQSGRRVDLLAEILMAEEDVVEVAEEDGEKEEVEKKEEEVKMAMMTGHMIKRVNEGYEDGENARRRSIKLKRGNKRLKLEVNRVKADDAEFIQASIVVTTKLSVDLKNVEVDLEMLTLDDHLDMWNE